MKRLLICFGLLWGTLTLMAQELSIEGGRFRKGDDPAWSSPAFDDSSWQEVTFNQSWEELVDYANGYGWYRIHVVIPSSLKKGVVEAIMLDLGAIDDAWEAEFRTPEGRIAANEKFPDMKALGDYLHANGLKFGIYSSPGDHTCGGYLGSLDHEQLDAEVWNEWTETSYLQPDNVYGYGYLDAVRNVFVGPSHLPQADNKAVSCVPGSQAVTVRLETGRDPLPAGDLGHNPICPMGVYMADPSAKLIDGRLYVACSLDLNTDLWCSPYYHMLSSDDALHWTLHPNVFATRGACDEVSYSDSDLYAPDIAERDGQYYLYYDMSDWTEGVARADSPAGPFRGGQRIGDITGIDPTVFIDDDGQAYYFWDQFSAQGARLNPDMKTLDMSTLHQGIVTEKDHYFHEGSFVFKRDGWYYFVYADISRQNMPTCIGYSMSRNVFGPYEYKGVIVDSNGCDPDVWNNHGSVVELNGQWYVLYHRSTHHSSKLRKACIEPITFNADGTINEVEMTSQGAGAPLSACKTIDAARACLFNGGPHIRLMEGRTDREIVSGILDGTKAAWKYVDFPAGLRKFTVRVRALAGGTITVTQDQPFSGRIARLDVPAGKGEWKTLSCEVEEAKEGPRALWLMFSGSGESWKERPELFEIDWMVFE